ncbi:metal ABC transporter ATP-binding protein [Microbacterium sp. CH12i]|uniref:anthranilate synthase component I family protein n=1 Tax=Microbacterium sp. CH12i TaxID=1479651 RepID=UPI00046168EC|nr:anthranilate synthase component I family protein [Microbacterium sp. CH12i]KDA06243.1 metal ABC transporter ATP-binding protein [Microbacterium sp. CH12i]
MPSLSPLALRRTDAQVDIVATFRALAARHEHVFWLDAGDAATEGWSVLGFGDPDTQGPDAADPGRVRLDVAAPADCDDEPPFRGGWVGWLDYESGAVRVGAPSAASEGGPAWLRVQQALAVDHGTGAVWVLGAEDALDRMLGSAPLPSSTASATAPVARQASARHEPGEYAALIEQCRDVIRAGTAYQLCLTTRFEVVGANDPIETYLRLRAATPAHHGGFVRIGARALLSASPETFLRTAGGRVRTRPIKGTRPRGIDAASDAALAAELRASAKERAENVMIVDLMRNDLSRVCVPGTIRVDGLWEVESYPAVHQLVSTVSGTVVGGLTVQGLWDAAFPAGSMTGAPKLSAMTVLHRLEGGSPRGVYSGCFGYVGVDGSMDLAMVIRSILIDGERAVVGAGGGITWGSEPDAEVAEVATKARAPLAALGAELPEAWRR